MKTVLLVSSFLISMSSWSQADQYCCNPKAQGTAGQCVAASTQGCAAGKFLVWGCGLCDEITPVYLRCQKGSVECSQNDRDRLGKLGAHL